MPETRFADNFDRLLGVHRLSPKRAAELLGVSPTSLSYWRNGHREPDRSSLYDVSIYFGVDPWEIMEAPAHEFLATLGDADRFDVVEGFITNGTTVADIKRAIAKAEKHGRGSVSDRALAVELEKLRWGVRKLRPV